MKTAREWAEELLRIGSARDGWTVVVCEEIDGYAETTADADEIAGRIRHKIAAVIEKAVLAERERCAGVAEAVAKDREGAAGGYQWAWMWSEMHKSRAAKDAAAEIARRIRGGE
jgi:hypothetical protein